MFDQCGCYMSLLQDLVEGACLISVVTICRCCRLGGGGMFDQVVTICRCFKTWWRGHV